MSKEDAPNFMLISPDKTCGSCLYLRWTLTEEDIFPRCTKYDFVAEYPNEGHKLYKQRCDSWEGE